MEAPRVDVSRPDVWLRDAFLRMLEDYEAHDPDNGEFYSAARVDFGSYVATLLDEERGVNLPAGYVPCSHRWLLDEACEMVGVARIRHNIDTPFLREEAGHIGYDVPPSRRGRGYGVACLLAALAEARARGLARVLLCADADNVPSLRTIERCGGMLEGEVHSPHYARVMRRYWITVGDVGREREPNPALQPMPQGRRG